MAVKGGPHPNAISVEGLDFLSNSHEVARLWVEDQGPATCIIQPDRLEDPEMFGMLMVDTIRHAGRAFASYLNISEAKALNRIWSGLDAERDESTTPLNTIQDYEKPN